MVESITTPDCGHNSRPPAFRSRCGTLIFPAWFFLACQSSVNYPEESLLTTPEDLEAVLWAESPLLYNPTNMDVDAHGRIWITEGVNYRNFNNDSTEFMHRNHGDRIVILEDSDNDGVADRSTVYVQDPDLVSPLGIAVIGNKVYVSCSPNLIVYTDENGDDTPDHKEVLLTGFGGTDHDHSLHAMVGGPDGNLYFTTGNAGPHRVSDKNGWTLRSGSIYTGGSPYNMKNEGNLISDDGRVWVGGLTLRINPTGREMKVMAHNFRNSYEVFVDSRGDMWQNDNDDQVVACRTAWVMEGSNAGYFSRDGTRFWQADHRPWQDVFTAHWHQDDPGVMPAGDRTGAGAPTGIVVVESETLGEPYLGMLLSADAGRNTIFGYYPEREGSGFALKNRSNWITSLENDNVAYVWNDSANATDMKKWFRPSDVVIGTDGSLYIADWYDPVVGGHLMQDTGAYGRIFRITPKGKSLRPPLIDFSSLDGLLEGLRNPAVNVRFYAFEKLREKGDEILDRVKPLLADNNRFVRYRIIWLMAQLGSKGEQEVVRLLTDEDEDTRVVAFRALRQVLNDITPMAKQLAHDRSAFVRREVVLSLKDINYAKKAELVNELISDFEGGDPWLLNAIGESVEGSENQVRQSLVKENDTSAGEWPDGLSRIMWTLHPSEAVRDFEYRAASPGLSLPKRLESLTALAFIVDRQAAEAMLRLTKDPEREVREQAMYWISFRQGNDWFDLLDWKRISIDTEMERHAAAVKVKVNILMNEEMPMYERKKNAIDLSADAVGGQLIMRIIHEGIFPSILLPDIRENMTSNPDLGVRIQAMKYFRNREEKNTLARDEILKIRGNQSKGAVLFQKNCQACHVVQGSGGNIGPDLTVINRKYDRRTLVDAVVNPSGGIAFGYEGWTITTTGGNRYFGFLLAENGRTVTIKDLAGNTHTIGLNSIVSRMKEETSIMPDPSTLSMNEEDVANVTAYLMNLP